jgi:hypothetical protein
LTEKPAFSESRIYAIFQRKLTPIHRVLRIHLKYSRIMIRTSISTIRFLVPAISLGKIDSEVQFSPLGDVTRMRSEEQVPEDEWSFPRVANKMDSQMPE